MIEFELLYDAKNLVVGLPIYTQDGIYITGMASDMSNTKLVPYEGRKYKIKFSFKNVLNPNIYLNVIAIHDGTEFLYRNLNKELEVINTNRNFGFISIEHQWDILKEKNER